MFDGKYFLKNINRKLQGEVRKVRGSDVPFINANEFITVDRFRQVAEARDLRQSRNERDAQNSGTN